MVVSMPMSPSSGHPNGILKDRQQEARAVLVGSNYIGDYHMPLEP